MKTAAEIAVENDAFRKSIPMVDRRAGMMVMTPGVRDGGTDFDLPGLFRAVREYANWEEGNDPYAEHDFGSVELSGITFFWKIEYYEDAKCQYGGDPKAGPVFRVLTLMKAEEY